MLLLQWFVTAVTILLGHAASVGCADQIDYNYSGVLDAAKDTGVEFDGNVATKR
jgi:hypothetical protein